MLQTRKKLRRVERDWREYYSYPCKVNITRRRQLLIFYRDGRGLEINFVWELIMRVRFVHFPSSGSIPLRFFTCRAMCFPSLFLYIHTMTRKKCKMDLEVINSPISNLYDLTHSKRFSKILLEIPIIQKLLEKVIFIVRVSFRNCHFYRYPIFDL